jgi:hypothetical protein
MELTAKRFLGKANWMATLATIDRESPPLEG